MDVTRHAVRRKLLPGFMRSRRRCRRTQATRRNFGIANRHSARPARLPPSRSPASSRHHGTAVKVYEGRHGANPLPASCKVGRHADPFRPGIPVSFRSDHDPLRQPVSQPLSFFQQLLVVVVAA